MYQEDLYERPDKTPSLFQKMYLMERFSLGSAQVIKINVPV